MEIHQEKIDWLNQIAQIQGIPIEDLKKYYTTQINDPTCISAFPNEDDLLNYVDNLVATFIQEFHSVKMTEYEIVVITSSTPRVSKAGNLYNTHVALAKLAKSESAPKWMNIINNEDNGVVERIESFSTGTIKVNVKTEDETQIDAFSRINTEFVPCVLSWVPQTPTEKKDWIKKTLRSFTIATAEKNLSAKTHDLRGINPCSLRWIQGNIATHRIIKKINEKTGEDREFGIITITDKSVVTIPDFGKSKQISDPNNPGKTITLYGGFSAFVEPDDIRSVGRGSECIFIGTLPSGRQMNVGTIIPILAIPPKKPTEKLQIPDASSQIPQDVSTNPAML